MNKFELIDEVRQLNSTASIEFLTQFDVYQLQEYIDHLSQLDSRELSAAAKTLVTHLDN